MTRESDAQIFNLDELYSFSEIVFFFNSEQSIVTK